MSPVISLLIPCSDFRREAIYSSLYQRMDAIEPLGGAKFPVFFPVNGNFEPETGSQVTASSAMQSAGRFVTNREQLSELLYGPFLASMNLK